MTLFKFSTARENEIRVTFLSLGITNFITGIRISYTIKWKVDIWFAIIYDNLQSSYAMTTFNALILRSLCD